MDRILVIFLVTVLTACGGGGGGGDSSSPAAVDDPQPHETDMRTGIFTDGPVSGLRYVQGELEDITNDLGEFTYDANSNAPVQFYVGNVLLGGARGQAVVTPYDLSSAGRAASLQSGFNISRFLISLDSSDDPDIQLPSNIGLANGSLDFTLSTGVFESNDQVQRLVQFYSESDLVSVADTEQHLQSNPHVQSDIAELQSQASNSLPTIDLSWDINLQDEGPLFQVESSNGEYLIAFVQPERSGSADFHISQIIHIDENNVFTAFRLNRNNVPTLVNANGNVYRYVNQSMGSFENFAQSVATYDHEKYGALYNRVGQLQTSYIGFSRTAGIEGLLTDFNAANFSEENKLNLLQHVVTMVEGLRCAYLAEASCSTQLSRVVGFVNHDLERVSEFVTFEDQFIDLDVCVELSNVAFGISTSCEVGLSLSEVLVGFSRTYQNHEDDVDIDLIDRRLGFSVESLPFYPFVNESEFQGYFAGGFECTMQFQRLRLSENSYYLKINSIHSCGSWNWGVCLHCVNGEPTYIPSGWDEIKVKAKQLIRRFYVGYGSVLTSWAGRSGYVDSGVYEQLPDNSDGWSDRYWDYISPYLAESQLNNPSYYLYRPNDPMDQERAEDEHTHLPIFLLGLNADLSPTLRSKFGVESSGHAFFIRAYVF